MNTILIIGFLAVVLLNWPMYRLIYWQQRHIETLKKAVAAGDERYEEIVALARYWQAVAGGETPPLPGDSAAG